ncbi:MAG: GAF domain-containing protein [Candidatus Latescibacteria bacterium]|jgi:HD-GYP domain-containing protein (c-di-GMP phosphodiesterase class II)|nr:GAF domain-containing protein [Candidatus Latescibacterota bacterium]
MDQVDNSLIGKLNKIGVALSSEHNLSRLLEMIVKELRSFTNSDGGSLYIRVDDELSFEVAQNDTFARRTGNVPFKSFRLPIDHKSIAGHVASTGDILNIPDLDKLSEDEVPFRLTTMREFDKKMDYKTVSMLLVPMRNHKDEIIGVVQLINSLDEQNNPIPFEKNVEGLVISIASQAAVAICNSVLIQDIKNLFESIVTYSAEAIDARSPHTAGHSERVSALVIKQAEFINDQKDGPLADINYSEEEINELRIASLLHDIGKIGVKERVLDKANKLSDEKVEAIVNRFAFINRDIENSTNLKKLESPELSKEDIETLDTETRDKIAEIDADIELIIKLNIPKYYSDEEGEHLEQIAKKKYIDINGDEKPYIDSEELENLKVKKGNLTEKERNEIQGHVRHTLNILDKIPFTEELKSIPTIAAAHHEMLNGSGYPNGIKGEDISFQSRIVAIADIYDALTAKDRPYKPPLPLEITLKILREEADNNKLDQNLVNLFISEEIYSKV